MCDFCKLWPQGSPRCKSCGCRVGLVPRGEGGVLCTPCSQKAKLCDQCPKPGTVRTVEAWLCAECYALASPGARIFSVRGQCYTIFLGEPEKLPWCGPRFNQDEAWRAAYNRGNG